MGGVWCPRLSIELRYLIGNHAREQEDGEPERHGGGPGQLRHDRCRILRRRIDMGCNQPGVKEGRQATRSDDQERDTDDGDEYKWIGSDLFKENINRIYLVEEN